MTSAVAAAGLPRCLYVSRHAQSIELVSGGLSLVFDGGDGHPLRCAVAPRDDTGWQPVDCGLWVGRLIAGPSTFDGLATDILVFQSDFFYRLCPASTDVHRDDYETRSPSNFASVAGAKAPVYALVAGQRAAEPSPDNQSGTPANEQQSLSVGGEAGGEGDGEVETSRLVAEPVEGIFDCSQTTDGVCTLGYDRERFGDVRATKIEQLVTDCDVETGVASHRKPRIENGNVVVDGDCPAFGRFSGVAQKEQAKP